MAIQSDSDPVRISLIGGRYLVFDYKQISRLRRDHNICAILVGTTPQNPSQNVFQGVPLEIGPEEATGLVSIGTAYIVDELQAHLNALDSSDLTTRDTYLKDLASRRRQFSSALDQEDQRKKQKAQIYRKSGSKGSQILKTSDPGLELETKVDTTTEDSKLPMTSLTTAHSFTLISPPHDPSISHKPVVDPLWRWLQSNGYYMTPGLRFGSHYSVYPGDPLRYHAHFLANSYPWDKPVPLLDLVGNGRLGTAVKKGFLIGGQYLDENGQSKGPFRAFTIEWAAM
ncbi:putative tRNA-splicing endonuclease subunit tsp-4 [Ceratocystis fimbriata CBS 114723]|uniref:tRNA-splicing endonuclease subunit Sen34 n=1 Tax=Ceratocystis fimbriata CBS 114723 TaxID=1035309 RepID=A0A2C5XIP2_9PEZI|nr:putative tRNA-splicing endonuclease subunit tsp-4 [Ceratocystis fimbriata CBS 114723]